MSASVLSNTVQPIWNFRYRFPNLFLRTFMYGMVGSLAMFITSWEKADRIRDKFLDKNRDYGDVYDFIIVGGGTAGSIVAYRLSKMYKVLVLEAGGDPHPFTSIPFMANFMRNYEELDWMYDTVPQKDAFYGSEGNQARISAGKGLGGTSNLDYMMYVRGHPRDYEEWARLTGDPTWSYDKLLKYFMMHEKYEGSWKSNATGQITHGTQGEMRLSSSPYSKLAKRFIQAGTEAGYNHVDLNGDYSEGFDNLVHPMNHGYRQSVYKSFLRRAQDRWNLVIHKYAHVHKILFKEGTTDAYAVEYERHGNLRQAFAKKEIIISAGAINSPKLLMLSGIGDSDNLQSLGIPVILHLPDVGKELQDHIAVPLGPFFTNSGESLVIDRDLSMMSFMSYTMGQGPFTTTGYEAAAMLSSESKKASSQGNPHWPDIQLIMYGVGLHETAAEDSSHSHRFKKSLMTNYYTGHKGKDAFTILVSPTRPQGRGEVRLKDSNPTSPPMINPRYLSNLEDVGVIVDGIKKTLRMVENTISFREIGTRFTNKIIDGCSPYKFRSDEYWACYTRLLSMSMGDVVGTVGIGRVVDNELRVFGTSRLRIIDASVMPSIVSGGTLAATLMIGEKGADMILRYWGKHNKPADSTESKNIRDILTSTAQKLRGIDTGSMFMDAMKETPSYKALTPQEIKDSSLSTSRGWANMFKPLYNMMGGWDINSYSIFNPNHENVTTPSPLKLVGTMFKNSLLKAGEDLTSPSSAPPSATIQSFHNLDTQPLSLVHFPTITIAPSATVSELFLNADTDPYIQNIPGTLDLLHLKAPAPDSYTLLGPKASLIRNQGAERSVKKPLASAVADIIRMYPPVGVPNQGSGFSTTLPILRFSASDKEGTQNLRLTRHDNTTVINTSSPETISEAPSSKPMINFKFTLTRDPNRSVFKSLGLSKFFPFGNFGYESQSTQANNTMNVSTAAEDYELLEPDTGMEPINVKPSSVLLSRTPYRHDKYPTQKEGYDLDTSVHKILHTNSDTYIRAYQNHQPKRNPTLDGISSEAAAWIRKDPKNLDKEVGKLMMNSSASSTSSHAIVPINVRTPNSIPFTRIVNAMVQKHEGSNESLKVYHSSEDDEDEDGPIPSELNGLEAAPMGSPMSLWSSSARDNNNGTRKDTLSFKIKILN